MREGVLLGRSRDKDWEGGGFAKKAMMTLLFWQKLVASSPFFYPTFSLPAFLVRVSLPLKQLLGLIIRKGG